MKYFIATDIHGSAYWAQKVADKFASSNADLLVLLGDVYNHGPRNPFPRDYNPTKVAEIFGAIANKIVAVRGNCDSQVDQMISNFTFVENNLLPLGKGKLFCTHGHVYNKDALPCVSSGDVVAYGHFHVSQIAQVNGVTCVNVGSPSLPKDGVSPYCIVSDDGVVIYDFDDNVVASKAL